jgi:four helix bundle protein
MESHDQHRDEHDTPDSRDMDMRDRDPRGGREPRDRVTNFEDMKVWQEAHQLVLKVFEITPKIPSDLQESVGIMMEKAAIEVPRNIAEGFRRRGSRNKAHYYNMAQSSLEGLRYFFILARDLKVDIGYDDLAYRGDQVARMLDGLVRSMTRGTGNFRGGRGGRGGRDRGHQRPSGAHSDFDSDEDRDEMDDE